MTDISEPTDLSRTVAELNDCRLEQVVMQAPLALAMVLAGRISWSNPAMAELLRSDSMTLRGRPWSELRPQPITPSPGLPSEGDQPALLRRDDGTSVPVICRERGCPGGGLVVAIWPFETFQTFTHRLEESDQRLRDFADAASDWFWEADAGFKLVHLSGRIRQIIGDAAVDWLGRRFHDLPDLIGLVEPEDARLAIVDKQPFRGLRLTLGHGGRTFVMEVSGVPVRDASRSFRGYRGVARDITAEVAADEHISWLARHDGLTGLANRSRFNEQLEVTLKLSRRTGQRFAVLLIDLDDFKRINDSYGHAGGDELLVTVARRIASSLRETDLAARLGGDEFAILQVGLHGFADASALARRVIGALAAPIDIGSRQIMVRASCGIAIFPDDGDGPAAVLRAADVALYRAKAIGGNAMLFFVPHMDAEVTRRRLLEQDLRAAIEADELTLHYQPQVDLRDGRIVGVEALARWRRSDGENVPPDLFVSIAEEFGHIHALGMWVMGEACRQARLWAERGFGGIKMAVNISALELEQDEFATEILARVADCGLLPGSLDLELTERIRLEGSTRIMAQLEALAEAGIGLAIDDFGTGQSSLAQLHRMGIGKLKIDRSFIRGLPGSRDSLAITRAIIHLARALGIATVAEGVETRSQLSTLRRLGCTMAQGHLLSRPLPPDEMLALLRAPPDWSAMLPARPRRPIASGNDGQS